MNSRVAAATLAAAFALAPMLGEAQTPEPLTYRCVGKDKKTYYGQTMPQQCTGLALEMLNKQGIVVKRIDPQADAEKQEQKKAEEAKKREEEAARKDQQRRDRALMATYTSEADIELARKRALADNDKALAEIDRRIASVKARQAELAKEMEFYQGKNKPPAKLAQDMQRAQDDLKSQEEQRAKKAKDVESINSRYDNDKRRYVELTRGTGSK